MDVQKAQQRYQQFVQLLPLTLEIAGLSHADSGKYFNQDQMEIRVNTIKNAYEFARKLAKDVIQE